MNQKINIGAGVMWREAGWDVIDNTKGAYNEPWKIQANAWKTGLPGNTYDIVYTSHTLEHIPHFMLERTVAEINRIMKIGGVLRISVPDLKKAAVAYVQGDEGYFNNEDSIHPADHLGMGSQFLNMFISPGHQTIAFNKSDYQPLGSYGHLTGYDFDMFRILLAKWGFDDIQESTFGGSRLEELRKPNVICDAGREYDMTDPEGVKALKTSGDSFLKGFDNKKSYSLYVEARKCRDEPFSPKKQFSYVTRQNNTDNPVYRLEGKLFRAIHASLEKAVAAYGVLKRAVRKKS